MLDRLSGFGFPFRRRKDYSKATVLLHNMRLMAVLDWWEIIRDFILTNPEAVPRGETNEIVVQNLNPSYKQASYISGPAGVVTKCPPNAASEVIPYEFKLNITDSEIVLVEDTSVWDSNAIILKVRARSISSLKRRPGAVREGKKNSPVLFFQSTTVISYRPEMLEKPLSCNLNHCEVFSCVLGMEEETALSIIDPVTVNMEVTLRPNISEARGLPDAMITSADRTLEVQMQHLCIRLSYHDFRMLSQMLESIPRQMQTARIRASEQENDTSGASKASGRFFLHSSRGESPYGFFFNAFADHTFKLSALGFSEEDCTKALEICGGEIDDAALWLTQNATHVPMNADGAADSNSAVAFQTVEVGEVRGDLRKSRTGCSVPSISDQTVLPEHLRDRRL